MSKAKIGKRITYILVSRDEAFKANEVYRETGDGAMLFADRYEDDIQFYIRKGEDE